MHGSVTWNNYYGYKVGCSLYGLEAVLCKCVIFLDSWIVNDLCRAQRWKLFFCWVFLAVLCQYTTVFCRCCPCSSVGVAHVVTGHFIAAVVPVERRVWSWRCLVCAWLSHTQCCAEVKRFRWTGVWRLECGSSLAARCRGVGWYVASRSRAAARLSLLARR